MQFASWNFIEVLFFANDELFKSKQSFDKVKYREEDEEVEKGKKEEKKQRTEKENLCILRMRYTMLCLEHFIRLFRHENDLQALSFVSLCVCVCYLHLIYCNWCFSYDYGHTSFVAHRP